ncbi:hypothetical protein Goari_009913, partial [Gossypium aridum]|nr:hypothetical protein [Gossypium aridum]
WLLLVREGYLGLEFRTIVGENQDSYNVNQTDTALIGNEYKAMRGKQLDNVNLVNVEIGSVPTEPCCGLIRGLADLEAALCICNGIRANVLGIIDINLPISLTILLHNCGREPSVDYQCIPN